MWQSKDHPWCDLLSSQFGQICEAAGLAARFALLARTCFQFGEWYSTICCRFRSATRPIPLAILPAGKISSETGNIAVLALEFEQNATEYIKAPNTVYAYFLITPPQCACILGAFYWISLF